MTAVSKKQERVSLLSKRLIRTNKINSNEAMRLQERLDGFAARNRQYNKLHSEEVQGIKANLNNVVSVKEKMEISPVRRKFLQEHGVNLHAKDVYMEDFITAVDNALVRRDNGKLLPNRDERGSDSDSGVYVPSIRAKSAKTEASSSAFSADNFPLHLPISMLNKKPKSKTVSEISMSVESLVDDDDAVSEKSRKQPGALRHSRPSSGKRQKFHYRVITPPIKGRHITEAYKEMEENEKLVQKLLEKKKFHERLKREEAMKKKIGRGDDGAKAAFQRCEEKAGVTDYKDEYIGKRHGYDVNHHSGSGTEDAVCTEFSWVNSEETLNAKPKKNQRKLSTTDEEFEKLMQKSLKLKLDRKARPLSGEANMLQNKEDFLPLKFDSERDRQSKNSNETMKSESAALTKEDSVVSSSINDNQKVQFSADLLETEDEEEVKSPSCFDAAKWNELVTKIRGELKEQEKTKKIPARTSHLGLGKNRISRITHPTAIGEDDDMIYDARPDKSVAKGYATMHMTVGKRSVSICVPRFKNEGVCKEQTAMRANAKSEFNVEQVREKKQIKKPRATSFD